MNIENVKWGSVAPPVVAPPAQKPALGDAVYPRRLAKVREKMRAAGYRYLVIYADREHYSNFRHLIGFEPRFEEGLLVVGLEDPGYMMLGNECYPMHPYAKIPVKSVLCPALSLPNQPMEGARPLADMLREAGISQGDSVGVIGWKLFTEKHGPTFKKMFDLPMFIMEALAAVAGADKLENATGLMINPDDGARITYGAEEIAVLEYGAAWAGSGVYNLLMNTAPGKSEEDLAEYLVTRGGQQSCHPYVTGGKNVARGLVSPSAGALQKGDALVTSMGLEGGLTCRKGYLAEKEEDLPADQRDYFEVLAKPYYLAVASWYEAIGLDVTGGEIFDLVNGLLPKAKYGWVLNPGHLIATEEWMASPIYPGSQVGFKSGTLVQLDIIPDMPPYGGVNAEDGVCIADQALRDELARDYPEVWARMQRRRDYMKDALGINLKPEVLPMSDIAGWYSPLILSRGMGFKIER